MQQVPEAAPAKKPLGMRPLSSQCPDGCTSLGAPNPSRIHPAVKHASENQPVLGGRVGFAPMAWCWPASSPRIPIRPSDSQNPKILHFKHFNQFLLH